MIARPPRWLLVALIVDGIFLGTLIARGFGILPPSGESILVILALLIVAIYAGVTLWVWLRPSPHAYGLTMGLYIIGLEITGAWLVLLALGMGMGGTLSEDDLRVLGGCVGLLLAQVALAIAAYRAAGRAGVQSRLELLVSGVFQLKVAGVVSLFGSLGLSLFVDNALLAQGNRQFEALRSAVYRTQGCAARHADAHPEVGYPPSLAAMGPAGDGCLDARSAAGRDEHGVAIEYTPETNNGRVVSFLVRARGRADGRNEVITGDTTGLTRNGNTVFGGSHDKLSLVRNCLVLYRAFHRDTPFPPSLVEVASALRGRDVGVYGAPLYGGCIFARTDDPRPDHERVAERLHGAIDDHWLTYRPNGEDDYVLEMRPVQYGVTAVRSYMMRSDGVVHVTLLDRPATDADSQVPICEYDEHRQRRDCVFLPGPPPTAAFLHDSTVVRDAPYRLTARDPNHRGSPPDSSLRFQFDCYAQLGSLNQSWAYAVRPEPEELCPPLDWRRDTVIAVRLWVMDRTGATAVDEDTLRVVEPSVQAGR